MRSRKLFRNSRFDVRELRESYKPIYIVTLHRALLKNNRLQDFGTFGSSQRQMYF